MNHWMLSDNIKTSAAFTPNTEGLPPQNMPKNVVTGASDSRQMAMVKLLQCHN